MSLRVDRIPLTVDASRPEGRHYDGNHALLGADGILVAAARDMKHAAFLIGVVILTSFAPSVVHSAPDLSGEYRGDGIHPEGRSYQVAVQIVRNGDTYVVQWLTPHGRLNLGVGFVSGNTLSVGYIGATAGVIVYTLDGDQLTGTWTDTGSRGRTYKETLTRLAEGEIIQPSRRGGPLF